MSAARLLYDVRGGANSREGSASVVCVGSEESWRRAWGGELSCNSFFNGHKVDVADKKGVLTAKGEEYTNVAQQHRRLWPRLAARAPPGEDACAPPHMPLMARIWISNCRSALGGIVMARLRNERPRQDPTFEAIEILCLGESSECTK